MVTLCESIADDPTADGRPAVMLYAGDFDATGEDIPRNLAARLNGVKVKRIALTTEQVKHYDLPPQPGKRSDTRSAKFELEHGKLAQVELDALAPEELRALYERALAPLWDESTFETVLERERVDKSDL